jgi:hypothetical protein
MKQERKARVQSDRSQPSVAHKGDPSLFGNHPARVAKSADAKDLKSFFAQAECGFKSRPGHHFDAP